MYTTCIFCHHDLGSNEAIEEFPVGRRLAFDSGRGRLWVVCRRCERWNLSPLDTRWEAIESCERLFHDTRLRASSDNIGLARLPEGLELVRVGTPLRDEFAAWRYGDQFGRRRKRAILYSAAGGTAVGAVVVGGAMAGVSMGITPALVNAYRQWHLNRPVHRLWNEHGDPIQVQRRHLYTSRLVPGPDGRWALHAYHVDGWGKDGGRRRSHPVEAASIHTLHDPHQKKLIVEGDDALRLASKLMAHANRRGGKKNVIRSAVERIEDAGHPDAFLPIAARLAEDDYRRSDKPRDLSAKQLKRLHKPLPGSLAGLPDDVRLAVEMATQEQNEREALEGELKALEAMWQQAEEIAGIADNLFVPESVEDFIEREKAGTTGTGGG